MNERALRVALPILVLALVIAWLGALFMVLSGVFQAFTSSAGPDTLYALLYAASLFGIGLLLVPSIYYGLLRLLGKLIKRKGVIRVICENPKHKQRQG